jgi:sugar phosphate isomerase/epimerase
MARWRFSPDAVGVCVSTMLADPATCRMSDLAEIASALEATGFDRVSLSAPYATDNGVDAVRARLDDAGISVRSVEALSRWQEGSGAPADADDELLDTAQSLGADMLLAATRYPTLDVATAAAGLAALCERADTRGIRVVIEPVPGRSIGDLATAWRVVRASGARNAGVVFDTMHWYNQPGGPDLAAITAIPGERLPYVQLRDRAGGPQSAPAGPGFPASSPEVMPGVGLIDIGRALDAVDATGADPYLALEVFGADTLAQGVQHKAARLRRAVDDIFASP